MAAFDLLNTIVTGEVTVHTMWVAVRHKVGRNVAADRILLNALIELAEADMIRWTVEHNYGRSPPERPSIPSGVALVQSWQAGFGSGGPRSDVPKHFTISVNATERGTAESQEECYGAYLSVLRDWYDWE